MTKAGRLIAIFSAVLIGAVVLLVNTASRSFVFRSPRQPDALFREDPASGRLILERSPSARGAGVELDVRGTPLATISSTTHDFGLMDPHSTGVHVFEIRNDGDGSLILEAVGTTCKCTVSSVEGGNVVAPGEVGKVRLEWNTGRVREPYEQTATIKTNDPKQPEIKLTVRGDVRQLIGAAPAELLYPRLEPDQPSEAETLIFSQVWDAFRLEDVASSFPGQSWTITPATPTELEPFQAKAGYRLRAVSPTVNEPGHFSGSLTLRAVAEAAPSISGEDRGEGFPEVSTEEPLEIRVQGVAIRRLAVYGPDSLRTDRTGGKETLRFGVVPKTTGRSASLTFKLRDDEPRLPLTGVVASPEWLEATFEPNGAKGEERGVYRATITIPPGAPSGVWDEQRPATVRFEFDHPRVAAQEFQLFFSVP